MLLLLHALCMMLKNFVAHALCNQFIYILRVSETAFRVHDMLCPHRFRIRAELLCGVFCLVLLFVNLILVGNGFDRSLNTHTHTYIIPVYLYVRVCKSVLAPTTHTYTHIICAYKWLCMRSDLVLYAVLDALQSYTS